MHGAGEAVWRYPLGERIGLKKCPVDLFRPGHQDTM
jgi:hypothetical protein